MSIKEIRDARLEYLYSQFVSVKGLINYFASEDGLDISEVATELERVIKNSNDSELPEFGSVDIYGVAFAPWSAENYRSELMGWLSDTIGDCGHSEHSDFNGWMREGLFPFLQSRGLDVKSNFPLWSPMSEITSNNLKAGSDKPKLTNIVRTEQVQNIESETFNRLMRAIEAFPVKYPDYDSKPPKLNVDVRPWLDEIGLVNDGKLGREASIFGRIIAEHFKL
jgi:hypothetical protein